MRFNVVDNDFDIHMHSFYTCMQKKKEYFVLLIWKINDMEHATQKLENALYVIMFRGQLYNMVCLEVSCIIWYVSITFHDILLPDFKKIQCTLHTSDTVPCKKYFL